MNAYEEFKSDFQIVGHLMENGPEYKTVSVLNAFASL